MSTMTVKKVATELGISRQAVHLLMRAGHIRPAGRDYRGRYYFDAREVERLAAARQEGEARIRFERAPL